MVKLTLVCAVIAAGLGMAALWQAEPNQPGDHWIFWILPDVTALVAIVFAILALLLVRMASQTNSAPPDP